MANWSLPSLTDLYSNFLSFMKARDDDAVRMNDSRVTSASNLPDYSKRWNATTQTLENWLSAAWSNLILAVAGGGTGATTAAGARTNLDVYSKSESDAKYAIPLTTTSSALGSPVSITSASTYYDGPSITLAAGTWFISADIVVGIGSSSAGYGCSVYIYVIGGSQATSVKGEAVATEKHVHLDTIITLGSNTDVKIRAYADIGNKFTLVSSQTPDNLTSVTKIRAIKIA